MTLTFTTFLPSLSPVPVSMFPPFAKSFDFGCGCPCGTVTALIIASLSVWSVTVGVVAGSTEIATFPFVTVGVALSASCSFLATSTSISLEISPRVTVTLTYFLPCLSVIFPYSIFSSSARSFSFAFTFAFTNALSSTDNSSPSVGSLEIFTESVVLSDKVKSSTFPDNASRAFFKLANALSTSVCDASSLLYTLLASFKAVSYAVFLSASCSLV